MCLEILSVCAILCRCLCDYYYLSSAETADFNSLNVVYTNADCFIQMKKEELILQLQDNSPYIIAITEIFPKTNSLTIRKFLITSMDMISFFANLHEGRGVIYVKSHLNAEQSKKISNDQELI